MTGLTLQQLDVAASQLLTRSVSLRSTRGVEKAFEGLKEKQIRANSCKDRKRVWRRGRKEGERGLFGGSFNYNKLHSDGSPKKVKKATFRNRIFSEDFWLKGCGRGGKSTEWLAIQRVDRQLSQPLIPHSSLHSPIHSLPAPSNSKSLTSSPVRKCTRVLLSSLTHPSITSLTHPSTTSSTHPSTTPATYLFTTSPTHPSTTLPTHPSTTSPTHPSTTSPTHPSTTPSAHPSTTSPTFASTPPPCNSTTSTTASILYHPSPLHLTRIHPPPPSASTSNRSRDKEGSCKTLRFEIKNQKNPQKYVRKNKNLPNEREKKADDEDRTKKDDADRTKKEEIDRRKNGGKKDDDDLVDMVFVTSI